jgi:hypothetical protein
VRASLPAHRALVWSALAIAALDGAQIALGPWRPRRWGAVGGTAIYLCIAAFAHQRAARWLAMGMPLVPISALASGAVAPEAPMLVIFLVQVGCGAAAWARERAER